MTINNKLNDYRQQRIRTLSKNSDAYDFFNLLTRPKMLSTVEDLLPEDYRERQFPPTETLSIFFAQAMNESSFMSKSL